MEYCCELAKKEAQRRELIKGVIREGIDIGYV
jgi:hypothetical protein